MDEIKWKKISTEHIVQNKWIDFRGEKYIFPNGVESGYFYTFTKQNYVVIVAKNTEGKYICVRQYRPGIDCVTCEFPAGGMEAGENPLDCAKRELYEETGHVSDDWKILITMPANATVCDNYFTVLIADNCRLTGKQNLDDTEFLNVEFIEEEKLEQMIFDNEFQQSNHVMAYYMAKYKQ